MSWIRLDLTAPRTAPRALAWYILITLAFTWPLVSAITRDVPHDLGDPLLNIWILGWNAEHFWRALGGDLEALRTLWHGNIFYPEPYTLAYSELLIAPSLQILPVYALTENLILSYNLLFLSTFVLSGLGMYLLARGFVGDWRIAFLCGLLFAFAPFRVDHSPHLQVMSSQWMPFALHGFHRFIETGRVRTVLGGALALAAQNLSCGYYLVYFALFVPAFVLFEIWRSGVARQVRIWVGFSVAAVLVAVITLPTMWPYVALQELHGTRRALEEIESFSADTLSWVTASESQNFWGPRLQVLPKPEGHLFPGLLPLALTAMGVTAVAGQAWRRSAGRGSRQAARGLLDRYRTPLTWLFVSVALTALLCALARIAGVSGVWQVLPRAFARFENHVLVLGLSVVGLVLVQPRARALASELGKSPLLFALGAAGVAWYLSLGPDPSANGASIAGPRLFRFLIEHVPGFDGLRAASRFAMIVVLFLSLAAAWGLRALLAQLSRIGWAGAAVPLVAVLWLAETWCAPLPVNGVIDSSVAGVANPPSRVAAGTNPPALMRYLRQLPDTAVLMEFPFAAGGWEMRYVYYSTQHWRPLINGFSGYAPRRYERLASVLREPLENPEVAWDEVTASGATHLIVHGQAYLGRRPPAPSDWLEASGAQLVARIGTDTVYAVPQPRAEPVPRGVSSPGGQTSGRPRRERTPLTLGP